MTKRLPPDPENMNADRAEWAAAALRYFQCATGADYDDALGDLLCDLMHWSDRNDFHFEAALSRARMHYEAETAPDQVLPAPKDISPIEAAKAITPHWMLSIWDFDALEIHPCAVIDRDCDGTETVEQCEPQDAHFWTVYGHLRSGGVDAFEDFPTEAEAIAFHDRLIAVYPHLAEREG
jgi:hypothetical protein